MAFWIKVKQKNCISLELLDTNVENMDFNLMHNHIFKYRVVKCCKETGQKCTGFMGVLSPQGNSGMPTEIGLTNRYWYSCTGDQYIWKCLKILTKYVHFKFNYLITQNIYLTLGEDGPEGMYLGWQEHPSMRRTRECKTSRTNLLDARQA
jgi:hypothetical protein